MKRFLVILLSITLILGGTMPNVSHANPELNKDLEVTIIKLKDLFNISNDYDGFTQRLDSYNGESNFYLNWTDSTNKLPDININIDSMGFIKSFNKYYYNDEILDKTASITKVEGEKIVLEFIKKITPEIFTKIKLKEDEKPLYLGDDSYNFEFYRIENNIAFYDNNITLRVNKYTGEVNNYNANWDKGMVFPNPKDAITLEKAKLAFKEEIGLNLIYKTSYGMYRMPNPTELKHFLTYSTLRGNKTIDAFTGKAIDVSYYRIYSSDKEQNALVGDGGLTPLEKEEIDKFKGIKDIIEIESISRNILGIDNSYNLENKNLFSSWDNNDEFQWMLVFRKDIDENNILLASISLNAKTGELISFNMYENHDPQAKPNINKEQALKLAKEYLNNNLKDKVDDLEYIEDNSKDGQLNYNFQFIRKSEGIYIENDAVDIGIDTISEKITSYSINWHKGNLPPKDNIIDLNKVYEILFQNIDYELRYVKVYNENNLNENNEEVKLVYDFKRDSEIIIDPFSGKFLDREGKEYTENWITEYIDIDKSYAKKKIQALSEYGISFKENKFRPKDKMKQSEFLYLLWKSIYNSPVEYNNSTEEMYKQLRNMNIVRAGDKDKNSLITKEEAVVYIIRAMKYDKLAEKANIFKDIWNDSNEISHGLKGYLNIAYGLDIINGDGKTNNINPKYGLNREDGANIIYKYLFMK